MFTDQSERSSGSRGSGSQRLVGGFEANEILKRKIGGLARRNIAQKSTKRFQESDFT